MPNRTLLIVFDVPGVLRFRVRPVLPYVLQLIQRRIFPLCQSVSLEFAIFYPENLTVVRA